MINYQVRVSLQCTCTLQFLICFVFFIQNFKCIILILNLLTFRIGTSHAADCHMLAHCVCMHTCAHTYCICRTYIYNTTHKHTHRVKLRFSFIFLNCFPAFPLLPVTTLGWNSLLVLVVFADTLTLLFRSFSSLQPLTRTIWCLCPPKRFSSASFVCSLL